MRITLSTGWTAVFRHPGGNEMVATFPRERASDLYDRLDEELRADGIEIAPLTNDPGWDGWPVDYRECVSSLGVVDGLR